MADYQTHGWVELRRLHREIRSLYQRAAEQAGLSEIEFEILRTVWELGGCCSQSDICRYTLLKKQTVNSAVHKLERNCLLAPNEKRGNAIPLSLTAKGRHLAEGIVAPIISMENKAFMQFSVAEQTCLLQTNLKYMVYLHEQISKIKETQMM